MSLEDAQERDQVRLFGGVRTRPIRANHLNSKLPEAAFALLRHQAASSGPEVPYSAAEIEAAMK